MTVNAVVFFLSFQIKRTPYARSTEEEERNISVCPFSNGLLLKTAFSIPMKINKYREHETGKNSFTQL